MKSNVEQMSKYYGFKMLNNMNSKCHHSKNVKITWVNKCQINMGKIVKGQVFGAKNRILTTLVLPSLSTSLQSYVWKTPVTLGYVLKRLVLEKQQDCGHFLWCSTNAALLVLYCGGFLHMKIYSSMRAYIGANIIPK